MLQIVVHNSSSSNWAVLIAVHVEGPNWIDDGMRIWEFVGAREKVKKDVFFPREHGARSKHCLSSL